MTRYRNYLNFFSDIYLDEAEKRLQALLDQGHISIFEHETLLNAIDFVRLSKKRHRTIRIGLYSFIGYLLGALAVHFIFK